MQASVPPDDQSTPHPPLDSGLIRAQLERILASPEFPSVGRSAAFLTYVVQESLEGRGDRIKGYTIAVEVFKRFEGYTQDDPVVRIEAGKLRRALERYYLTAGRDDQIRIDIPKGGYVPTFTVVRSPPDIDQSRTVVAPAILVSRPRIDWRIKSAVLGLALATSVGVGLFAAIQGFTRLSPADHDEPTLVVAPFANLGGGPQAGLYTAGLTEELLTALPRFKEIRVFGRETSKNLAADVAISQIRNELGARFLLAGGVRMSGSRIRVTARVLDTENGTILWSQDYDDDTQSGDLFDIQSDVANKVATAIAQPYGIMAKADAANPPPNDLGTRQCALNFYEYRGELSAERHARVRSCLETSVSRFPSFATGWAMLSIIYLDEDRFRFNTRVGGPPPIVRSLQAARNAVQLEPDNVRGQQALMTSLFFNQQVAEALRIGEKALSINPNDTELLGEFGTRLAMSGQWKRGSEMLDRALALNPGGSGYYQGTRALAAYMLRDKARAVMNIKQADLQKFPLFHAVAAVIYVDAGLIDDARREATVFNQMRPDFAPNIVAELKARNFTREDSARLIADARKAGLPVPAEPDIAALASTASSSAP
ncbi:adenylate cyclase [Ochrobactrum sp. RH2CCR150]|uniref:adenylate cyclase n=1 Tax=Ochrobactrum sp. RH2CCR150 TaxID=2587044 RepID=UPI00182BB741|nr:TolB-like protein [Ochrobactrum sp. RH2CCR150]